MCNAKTITLNYDQIDSIVVDELKAIYEQHVENVHRLENTAVLRDFEIEDRAHSKELLNATRVLLEYHMPYDEAAAYFRKIADQHQ